MTGPDPATLDDLARRLTTAGRIIVVPGYGLAVARAQHELRQLVEVLRSGGAVVDYAIHPVAGRMPGQLNVLLDEAGVPHDQLRIAEAIDDEFASADLALVVGADDVVNPAAEHDPASPLFGMPILHVDRAASVLVLTRAPGSGYVGTANALFDRDQVTVLVGDARASLAALLTAVNRRPG